MRASARLLLLPLLLLVGCGGSASETPFPQSPDEITTYPTLKRPRGPGAGPRASAGRGTMPPPATELGSSTITSLDLPRASASS